MDLFYRQIVIAPFDLKHLNLTPKDYRRSDFSAIF